MSRLSCISILESGAFATDSGTVTVPQGGTPFPISTLVPASARGAAVARGVGQASIGRAAASRGAAIARAVGSSTHAARGSSAGGARATAQGSAAAPAYATTWWDAFSDGNRTGTITVSTTASISSGPINKLVDGSLALSLFWSGGQTSKEIKFDFGSGATVVIDAFGWRQDGGAAHGTWVLEGSNDDSSYTQIGSSFTLGQSGQPQVFYALTNNTPYRYYKLRQTAGSTSGTPFLLETNFRATSSAGARDAYEKGDRTSLITVTTTASVSAGSAINNLVDGAYSGSVGDSFVFGAAQSTREIKFDLGSGVQKTITDFVWLQSGTNGHGTWVMEGSNDDSSYTQLGSSFTLGGACISKYNLSNATAYRYYKLRQTAGSTSTAPFIQEIEFKIT